MFGHKSVLLETFFDQNTHPNSNDIVKSTDYATELRMCLKEFYQCVARNLDCNRSNKARAFPTSSMILNLKQFLDGDDGILRGNGMVVL